MSPRHSRECLTNNRKYWLLAFATAIFFTALFGDQARSNPDDETAKYAAIILGTIAASMIIYPIISATINSRRPDQNANDSSEIQPLLPPVSVVISHTAAAVQPQATSSALTHQPEARNTPSTSKLAFQHSKASSAEEKGISIEIPAWY